MADLLPVRQLADYLYCARKLFYEERLGKNEYRKAGELRRSIKEEALRYTNTQEEGLIKSITTPLLTTRILDLYRSAGSRALQEAILNHKEKLSSAGMSIIETSKQVWQELQTPLRMRAEHTSYFMRQNRVYGNELWRQLLPKLTFGLKTDAPILSIRATVDRLDTYPHGAIPSIISKQEAPPEGLWGSDRIQLAATMMILAENGMIVHEGVVMYDDGKDERDLTLTPELAEAVKRQLQLLRELYTSTKLPARVQNMNKCKRCPHQGLCYDDAATKALMAEKFTTIEF